MLVVQEELAPIKPGAWINVVDIRHPQRKADLREALRRALNTWERPPEWLTRLYDELGG